MKIIFTLLCFLGIAAHAEIYTKAYEDNQANASVIVIINSTTMAECVQKYNELVQKLEVTNKIIMESVACVQRDPKYPNIFASISILKI